MRAELANVTRWLLKDPQARTVIMPAQVALETGFKHPAALFGSVKRRFWLFKVQEQHLIAGLRRIRSRYPELAVLAPADIVAQWDAEISRESALAESRHGTDGLATK